MWGNGGCETRDAGVSKDRCCGLAVVRGLGLPMHAHMMGVSSQPRIQVAACPLVLLLRRASTLLVSRLLALYPARCFGCPQLPQAW